MRYKAFISYSHRDEQWSAWLQRALEGYRVPRYLVGTEGEFGPIEKRLTPVFRDREDLSTGADLSGKVQKALQSTDALIVICSPSSAQSKWVNREIEYFQQTGRADRIYALIVDGDPQSDDPDKSCFPSALSQSPDGSRVEPLAADARKWADGKLLSKLKLISGILGIPLDALRQRDLQRRHRMWFISMAATFTIAVVMTVLAVTAITARQAAENRREHAEELVGYMVGDLRSKLDEVGRLDILEGMGGRVSEYLESLDPNEVTDESLNQQAQVWRQLGEVSMEQGEMTEALRAFRTSRDILAELNRRNPGDSRYIFELGNAEFWVGYVHIEQGRFDQAERNLAAYLDSANRLIEMEPARPEWVMEKSYAHSNLAALELRRGQGDMDRAVAEIQLAVEYNRQVMELAPDNPAYVSEYGETLAWLADTQMEACKLGDALISRQESVNIARAQSERAPGNAKLKGRYAFALTGLGSVAWQVGLLDSALEHYRESQSILGQLSAMEPSNLDYRNNVFVRDVYIAQIMAEHGEVEQALRRFASVRAPLERIQQEHAREIVQSRKSWLGYLLAWSETARVAGDPEQAGGLLNEVIGELESILNSEQDFEPFIDLLREARFLLWQLNGEDLLARAPFDSVSTVLDSSDLSCKTQADLVRQSILTGDWETAGRASQQLLEKGYFAPRYVRTCREYGLCESID